MRWIQDLAIDRKLVLIMMLTVGTALVVACVTFVLTDSISTWSSTKEELRTLAGIVGNNSVSALAFDDAEVAEATLESLRTTAGILGGCLYTDEGAVLAKYARPEARVRCPLELEPAYGARFERGELVVLQLVQFQGDPVGAIYLRSDLSRLYARIAPYLIGTLLAVGAASLIAWAVSSRLKNLITAPILELAGAVEEVTRSQEYSIRVRGASGDEIGLLMNGFNGMLEQIQLRDSELRKARDELEQRVEERTGELEVARDAAQAASRAKSEFLANMSHEIRTPLNAVMGLTEVTLATELSDAQRDYLGTVRDSAESLLGILNDILDFSKIEAGKLDLEQVPFSLCDTVDDTLTSLAMRAESKGLELACFVDPNLPSELIGDPGRLRQVISNLVCNAIKFTSQGEVVVRVEREAVDRTILVHFSVRDTGIGIAPAQLDRLFEPFEQADTSTTRRFGGTGLGLSICRQLVELMGGEIGAESALGEGSTFHFTSRFGVLDEVRERGRDQPLPLEGTRVLIVDDNATNRTILDQITRAKSMQPLLAASAEEGLALLVQSIEAGEPIPLLISDVHMPDVDGFGFVERIRADDRFADLEIIFLTSAGQTGDLARCEQLRIAARLVKPVRQSELFQVMARTLDVDGVHGPTYRSRRAGRWAAEASADPELPPLEILLVDDSLANRKVALAMLSGGGHTIAIARNGREALERLAEAAFDVVLMDVQMPEMDGFEATSAIRAREESSGTRVPIIAMTAHALQGDRERCLEAGMDGYVSKPVRRRELLDALAATKSAHGGKGTGSSDSTRAAAAIDCAVDWSELLAQVRGDRSALAEIVDAYATEIRECLSGLPVRIAAGEADEVRRLAHTLKGAMLNFGAEAAADEALALEQCAALGNLAGADHLLTQVCASSQRVLRELDGFADLPSPEA